MKKKKKNAYPLVLNFDITFGVIFKKYLFLENPNRKPVSFGTTQSRGLFPHVCAPDRTGNELYPMKGAPNRGPGLYNNAEVR